MFHNLQRMLKRRAPDAAAAVDGVIVGTPELLSALDRLQRSAGSDSAPQDLRRRLDEDLHLGGNEVPRRILNQTGQDILDLVFLLFEHLLQGNDIPGPLADLIGRLLIPTLKVTLEDQSFFDDKHHPARRLLNHLFQVAIGWKDDGDRSSHSVYGRSRWVVDQVSACEEWDPTVFAELDIELCELLLQEGAPGPPGAIREQRDPPLDKHEDVTRRLVKNAVDIRLKGRGAVPEAVASLIYEGWQQVLLAAYHHEGLGGARWQDAMVTMDRLVWSVQPKVSDQDRRELLRSIPELLRTLRQSLSEVPVEQHRLARWFQELQALHTLALRGAGPVPAGGDPRNEPIESRLVEPSPGDTPIVDRAIQEMLTSLKRERKV